MSAIGFYKKYPELEEWGERLSLGKPIVCMSTDPSNDIAGIGARINDAGWLVIRTSIGQSQGNVTVHSNLCETDYGDRYGMLIAAKHIAADSSWYISTDPYSSTDEELEQSGMIAEMLPYLTSPRSMPPGPKHYRGKEAPYAGTKRVPDRFLCDAIQEERKWTRKRKKILAFYYVLQARLNVPDDGKQIFWPYRFSDWFDLVGLDQSDDYYEVMEWLRGKNDRVVNRSGDAVLPSDLVHTLGTYETVTGNEIMDDPSPYDLRIIGRKTRKNLKVVNRIG